jgi:hypothetical protein
VISIQPRPAKHRVCYDLIMWYLRPLAYLWALPTTLLGVLFIPAALISGGGIQLVNGVIEVYGGFTTFFLRYCTLLRGGASAMTLGHIVLGRDRFLLQATRAHERVHVRQAERWGPFFIPAYALASLTMLLLGRNPYHDNPFEREAYGWTLAAPTRIAGVRK